MKLHQLRAVVTVADTGSFMAAAERLGISQSSLSHAVGEMEQELRLRLLERSRVGTKPTEAGKRILGYARQVFSCLDSIRAEASNAAGLLEGRVRVGAIPSVAIALLPKVIAHFARVHPNVEVIMLEEPSQGMVQLREWLDNNMIDTALLQLPIRGLHVVPLLQDELCAIIAKGSPLGRKTRLSIRELAEQSFIMSRYNSEHMIRARYAAHNLSPMIRFEVQDLGTLVSMVREGLGISIVPRVAFPVVPPGVVLRQIRPSLTRQLGFVMKSADRLSPAIQTFVRKAKELVQDRPTA